MRGEIIAALVATFLTALMFTTEHRNELIARGLAGYCAPTGGFAYNGECGE